MRHGGALGVEFVALTLLAVLESLEHGILIYITLLMRNKRIVPPKCSVLLRWVAAVS